MLLSCLFAVTLQLWFASDLNAERHDYGRNEYKSTEREWVSRCVAEYKQRAVSDKNILEEEKDSHEMHYPTNYEPAYRYEKLHVSELIYPLKIHQDDHQRKRTEDNYAYNEEKSYDDESEEDGYGLKDMKQLKSSESDEVKKYDRGSYQSEEQYSNKEGTRPLWDRTAYSNPRTHRHPQPPQHLRYQPPLPRSQQKQQAPQSPQLPPSLSNQQLPQPAQHQQPPPLTPQQLPPPSTQPQLPTPSLPRQPPPIAQQPPQIQPGDATSCPRKSLEKCSAFSRCVDGTGGISECWPEGEDMVFDEATQECRSFEVIPDCQKGAYCSNLSRGWTAVGGKCTKVAFMCGVAEQDGADQLLCPGNMVLNPKNNRSCINRLSAAEVCAQFPS